MKSWVAAVFLEIFVIIWISARAICIYGKYFQRCCWWKGCTLQHFQLVLHHSDCSFQRVRCCKVSPTYRHTCMLIHLLWFCGSRSRPRINTSKYHFRLWPVFSWASTLHSCIFVFFLLLAFEPCLQGLYAKIIRELVNSKQKVNKLKLIGEVLQYSILNYNLSENI